MDGLIIVGVGLITATGAGVGVTHIMAMAGVIMAADAATTQAHIITTATTITHITTDQGTAGVQILTEQAHHIPGVLKLSERSMKMLSQYHQGFRRVVTRPSVRKRVAKLRIAILRDETNRTHELLLLVLVRTYHARSQQVKNLQEHLIPGIHRPARNQT